MEKTITMTEEEYNNLLADFVAAWMEYQQKGYGNHLVSNETGEKVVERDGVGGAFLIPWVKVFK